MAAVATAGSPEVRREKTSWEAHMGWRQASAWEERRGSQQVFVREGHMGSPRVGPGVEWQQVRMKWRD